MIDHQNTGKQEEEEDTYQHPHYLISSNLQLLLLPLSQKQTDIHNHKCGGLTRNYSARKKVNLVEKVKKPRFYINICLSSAGNMM
jgi:hypothetical protein